MAIYFVLEFLAGLRIRVDLPGSGSDLRKVTGSGFDPRKKSESHLISVIFTFYFFTFYIYVKIIDILIPISENWIRILPYFENRIRIRNPGF